MPRHPQVLVYFVGRVRQVAHAQDHQLAQHRVERRLEQQRVAELHEAVHRGLGMRQHAVDVEHRVDAADEAAHLLGQGVEIGIRDTRHGAGS